MAASPICYHRHGSIQLSAGEASAAVMTLNEASLAVPGLTIGVVRRAYKCADAVLRTPAQSAVVWNIVKQQAIVIAKPNWAF